MKISNGISNFANNDDFYRSNFRPVERLSENDDDVENTFTSIMNNSNRLPSSGLVGGVTMNNLSPYRRIEDPVGESLLLMSKTQNHNLSSEILSGMINYNPQLP